MLWNLLVFSKADMGIINSRNRSSIYNIAGGVTLTVGHHEDDAVGNLKKAH